MRDSLVSTADADVAVTALMASSDDGLDAELPTQLTALYFYSIGLRHLSVLWLFSLLCTAAMCLPVSFAQVTLTQQPSHSAYVATALFLGAVAFGGFQRTSWGRVAGILLCLMLVAVFPIGTVIGLIGLVIYVRGGKLFGANAISHRTLQQAYQNRQSAELAIANC